MKHRHVCAALLAACLAIIAGTALAAGLGSGLLDRFHADTNLTPADDAIQYVAFAPAVGETDEVRYTVREAVYDGTALRTLIAAEALDPEHVVLMEENDEEQGVIGDAETLGAYAERTGKRLLDIGYLNIAVEGISIISETGNYTREGESLLFYTESDLDTAGEGRIKVFLNEDAETDKPVLSFLLDKSESVLTDYIVSQDETGDVTVQRAALEESPFAAYFTVEYSTRNARARQLNTVLADGKTYYLTSSGRLLHEQPDCSGLQNASAVSKDEAVASGKAACPICITGAPTPELYGFTLRFEDGSCLTWDGTAALMNGECLDIGGIPAIPDGYVTFTLQNGAFPSGDILLTPLTPAGEALTPIELTVK